MSENVDLINNSLFQNISSMVKNMPLIRNQFSGSFDNMIPPNNYQMVSQNLQKLHNLITNVVSNDELQTTLTKELIKNNNLSFYNSFLAEKRFRECKLELNNGLYEPVKTCNNFFDLIRNENCNNYFVNNCSNIWPELSASTRNEQ